MNQSLGRKMRKKNKLSILVFSAFLFFFAFSPTQAEDENRIAIQAEKIFTISQGILHNGLILLEGGKIAYVGPVRNVSKDFSYIKAKVIIPGLIDTHAHLGAKSGEWNENQNKVFTGDVNPSLKIIDVIDKESVDFAFALSGGVTSVAVMPGSGNIIGGELVVLKTAGDSFEKRILRNPAGLKMTLGPPQFLEVASKEFEKTRKYLEKKRRALEKGEFPEIDLTLEAMAKVLNREIPAHIHCIQFYAIEDALRLKEKFNIDVVIEHGLEADKVIPELHEKKVPISFGPLLLKQAESLPDAIPALFEKAGIKFSIHSDAPIVSAADLLLYAKQAVKYGLSEETALRSVTLSAAEILGIEDRVGSIEPGKDADLVIMDGEPLEIMTHVESILIDGKIVFQKKIQ
jgi:imidazolonepropionase-like amidohydrolase